MVDAGAPPYVDGMEGTARGDLVVEAVEIAESFLRLGQELDPIMITDRWGDRRVEEFGREDLEGARARLLEFLRTAAGEEDCALAYLGHVEHQEAIVIEHGKAGRPEAEVLVQRFRPRRGPLRSFKLVGEPTPVGQLDPVR